MSSKSTTQATLLNEKKESVFTDKTGKGFKAKISRKVENSAARKGLSLAVYAIACLVSYTVLLSLIAVLLPPLILFYVLKYIERKLVFMKNQSVALSGGDALWQQETPWNLTIINGILVFEGQVPLSHIRDALLERGVNCRNSDGTLKLPRFSQCIRKGYFQYFWEKDKSFNIDNHVFEWDGDIPSSKSDLQAVISELISKSFPDDMSPWQMIVIPTSYENKDTVVVSRMSHSIGDGVSLSRFFTHQFPDYVSSEKEPARFSMQRKISMMIKAILVAPAILLGKLFLLSDNSILHGPQLDGSKKVAWTDGIELDLIKHIKNKTGTTVNDVLMTCMSMALRSYFISKGAEIPQHFTSCVPVDVGGRGPQLEFGNRFAVVFLQLPTGEKDPLSLLIATKANMDVIKTSGEPIVLANAMHYGAEFFPEWIVRPVVGNLSSKASCVLSNVPGPQKPLRVKGHTVKFMTFWPPQRENIGVALSIYSYSGQVFVGVEGDAAVLPHPELITDTFRSKVDELAQIVDQF